MWQATRRHHESVRYPRSPILRSRALPDRPVRGFSSSSCSSWSWRLSTPSACLEGVHPRPGGQLRLLRLVGLALLLLLAGSTLVNQARRRGDPPGPDRGARRAVLAGGGGPSTSACSASSSTTGSSSTSVTDGARARSACDAHPPLLQIMLPVGISFFTFQALSYVIDIVPGRASAPMPLARLRRLPVVLPPPRRRADRAGQRVRCPSSRTGPTRAGSTAARGVPAHRRRAVQEGRDLELPRHRRSSTRSSPSPRPHGRSRSWSAIYAYAIQIYADFCGYTDIAIGCALLLGHPLPPELRRALHAPLSLQDFWRRWHMTLSRWLRDYLYIPLGGNRGGERRTYRNLFLTMVLGGLWHGAAWTFVVWGAIHGGCLVRRAVVRDRWRHAAGRADRSLRYHGRCGGSLTFHVVCLAWVFFRADRSATAFDVLGGIAHRRRTRRRWSPMLVLLIGRPADRHPVRARRGRATGSRLRFARLAPGLQGWPSPAPSPSSTSSAPTASPRSSTSSSDGRPATPTQPRYHAPRRRAAGAGRPGALWSLLVAFLVAPS